MSELMAARAQMGSSLAFHICFSVLGIGMPLLLLIAELLWLRTGRQVYRDLARMWAKAFAVTFAVGAVSGTMLSFELGLLWPRFMAFAGAFGTRSCASTLVPHAAPNTTRTLRTVVAQLMESLPCSWTANGRVN